MEFWVFGEVKFFLISGGGCPMRGRGLYFLGGGQFILRPFSHFKKQVLKNSSISACGALVFNLHIFRFKTDAELQVNIDFNTESKFFCSRSSLFSPLSGQSNSTKPMKLLSFFYHLMGLEGPPNHSATKARIFCVNVNKHGSYLSKSKVILL